MSVIAYYTSQIIVIIAYIVLGIGFRKQKMIQILAFSNIYHALMLLHYVLLGGLAGIIASIIALLRNFIFMYNEKNEKSNHIWLLILFCFITIICTIFIYSSISDIFPCILTLIGIYSYWCQSTKVTRFGNLFISVCYIIYSLSLKSWITIFCELYIIYNTIIGYLKYECSKNKKAIQV